MQQPYVCPVCGCGDGSMYLFSPQARVQLGKKLNVDGVVADAINQVYNDRAVKPQTQTALFTTHYEPLKQAVNEGYGQPLASIEYNSPNYGLLKNLQTNTAVFAIFKAHAFTKNMVALLKDDSGNVRPKEQFKAEALKLDKTYRVDWLDTEYDTAVRSSRMAAIYQKALTTIKLYPNLRYMPSRAAHPRADHVKYYGIVAPVDGVFYATHLPPNGFKCQCSVQPTDEETTDIPHNLPAPDKGFAFNSGITGQVFDLKDSNYIKSVPPKERPALIKQAEAVVNTEAAKTAPPQPIYTSKKGTEVVAHPIALKNADFKEAYATAKDMANSNLGLKKIEILPIVHDKGLRGALLPTAKEAKNPDYKIDGKTIDLKSPSGEAPGNRTFKNLIGDAQKQADGIALVIPDSYKVEPDELYSAIGYKLRRPEYADFEMYLKFKGVWAKYNQAQWLAFYKAQAKK